MRSTTPREVGQLPYILPARRNLRLQLTKRQVEILIGTILGDGYIYHQGKIDMTMNVIYALLRMLMDFLKKKAVGLTMAAKLFLIVVFGFVIRLYAALNAVTISTDSIGYLKLSREFLNGTLYQKETTPKWCNLPEM